MATRRGGWAWIAGGLAVGWLGARWLVPRWLEAAYYGRAASFLNALVTKQETHTLQDYLDQWNRVSWGILVLAVAALLPWVVMRGWDGLARRWDTGPARALRPWVVNAGVALVAIAVVLTAWHRWPVTFVFLVSEDYWAEHLGFLAWMVASILLVLGMFRYPPLRRPVPGILSVACFFVAMEEISWGQNLLSFPSPAFFRENNLQGETNVHNLVENQIKYHVFGWVLLGYTLLGSWLARLLPFQRGLRTWEGIPTLPVHLWPYFLASVVFFVSEPVVKSDEIAETLLAVAILALAVDMLLEARERGAGRRPSAGFLLLGTHAYLVALSMVLVVLFTRPDSADWRLRSFALDHYPRKGMPDQAATLLRYVNADPVRSSVGTLAAQARLELRGGNPGFARDLLDRAATAVAESPEEWVALAEVWVGLGECRQAGQALESAGDLANFPPEWGGAGGRRAGGLPLTS